MPRSMQRAAATIIGSLLALSLPSAAAGQTPAPTPPPPAPTPAPAPAPPAAGALSIKLERTQRAGHDEVIVRGDRVRVRGAVAPFAAGQTVVVRLYQGRKKLKAKSVAVKPVAGTPNGAFVVSLKPRSGRLTVRAGHAATPGQVAMSAKAQRLLVVKSSAGPGARGPVVRLIQSRLAALHYVVSRSGTFDASTGRAVVAYRKVRGMSRVESASRDVIKGLLARRGSFKPKHPEHGKHVEVDLSRQVLALMRGKRVQRIYSVSSGKASTPTVLGRFRVYSKTPGTNAKGMVDSSYFIGGYAIHGYVSVPTFPASHGCVRVPIPNARSIYDWLRMGDRVDTYP
jgi:peptidoglycan hydrolase-like protein with peptidoglycan-binding domain